MDQEPPSSPQLSPKYWLILIGLGSILLVMGCLGGSAWLNYAKTKLLWDEQHTAAITFSFLAIPFALMFWFGVRSINKLPDSVPLEKRRSAVQSLVVQPFGWGLLLVSYTLSSMREQWHVSREIYFTIATAATAIMAVSMIVQFRLTKVKSALFSALIWLFLFAVFLYRFMGSESAKGLTG